MGKAFYVLLVVAAIGFGFRAVSYASRSTSHTVTVNVEPGEPWLVKGVIDDSKELDFLIDTGATFSVIKWAEKEALGDRLKYVGEVKVFDTKGREVRLEKYHVQKIRVGTIVVRSLDILVLTVDGEKAQNLLGKQFIEGLSGFSYSKGKITFVQ
jgi:clan AA aspartic protease (TIGR02281 family)